MENKSAGRPRGGKHDPVIRAYWRRMKEKNKSEGKEGV